MRNRLVAVVLGLGILGAAGVAHVWYITRGVHFKGERVDFGAPPARLTMSSVDNLFENDLRPGTTSLKEDYRRYYEREDREAAVGRKVVRLRQSAARAESAHRYQTSLNEIRKLQALVPGDDFVRVRSELLPIAIRSPRLNGLKETLGATQPGAKPLSAERIARLPKEIAPYALYDDAMKTPGDPRLFERLAREYPDSPRAEAALIMIPRRLLSEPVNEKTPDLKSRAGRSFVALQTLSKRFPKSRFRYDAEGWRGRIDLLMGRPKDALRHFDVQDKLANDLGQRIRVADSRLIVYRALNDRPRYALSLIHRFQLGGIDYRLASRRFFFNEVAGFSSEQSKQFLNLILADSEAFPSYFDLRLDTSELSKSQVAELARVAARWSNRHPNHPRSSRVLARVAEVHYLQNGLPEARAAAETVLKRETRSDEGLALAHYILGSIDRRRNRLSSSQRHYETIVNRYAKTYLGPGAREALAVVHERRGNLGGALDQYFALGYKYDVAYMLDARMTTRQIADYLAHRPRHHRRELIAYSLGVRYVREGNYPAARSVLGRIPERRRRELAWMTKKPGEYGL
ncbi:MAG TPA: hypothetical protein PLX06_08535, partial [Fimbriimonadaceae bacterium]|nr:hypothetical protein [Fimbriimonadaceae bacterium]